MPLSGVLGADFASFFDACQKAEVSLTSFESGGAKVEQRLNKVSDAFSGKRIIQDATLMAEVFDRAGGSATFTTAELAKMGAVGAEAAAKLRAIGQDVPPGIQRIAAAATDANSSTSKWLSDFGNQLSATALGMVSAQAAIGLVKEGVGDLSAFLSSSVTSYASAEAAARKMNQALEAQGTASAANIADFDALASQFQRTTAYSDDLINEMQALLTQIGGVAPNEMRKALKAATDLASGLGVDLRTATLLVAKASEENVAALKKAGVQLDDTRVAGEGMEYILGKIEDRFGGQAQAELDTYSGKIKQLANDWDNFKEAVGKSIIQDPLLIEGLKLAQEHVQALGDSAGTSTPTITQYWASLAGADTSVRAIGNLSEVLGLFQDIDAETRKLKPPDLKAFTDWGNDFKALDKEAAALTKEMIAGWGENEKAEVKAHAQEVRDIAERNKLWEESQAIFSKLMSDATAIQVAQGGTFRDIQIAQILAAEQAEIASLTRRGTATAYNLALLRSNTKATIDGLGTDWDLFATQSIAADQLRADDALKTYEKMAASGQFFRDDLDKQLAKYHELRDAATAMGHAAVEAEDGARVATKKATDELEKQLAANEALIRSRTATFEITKSNLGQAITQSTFGFVSGATGYNPGGAGQVPTAFVLAGEGYSFAEILAILRGGPKGTPIGPRIPGFRNGVEDFEGGPAIVGEGGPELVNLPRGSDVIPLGRGGGTSIVVHQYITGVIDAALGRRLADATGNELMTRLKIARQLGAA